MAANVKLPLRLPLLLLLMFTLSPLPLPTPSEAAAANTTSPTKAAPPSAGVGTPATTANQNGDASTKNNNNSNSLSSYVVGGTLGTIVLNESTNTNTNSQNNNNNTTTTSNTATNDNNSNATTKSADAAEGEADGDDVAEEDQDDHPRFTFETFVTISVTLLTVLSNCTIIIVAAWTDAFHNFNKIFIYSMSLADLLIGLLVTPYSIFLSIYRKWVFVGGTFCNVEAYVLLTLHGAKLFSLTWLNVDHYIAVRKPERYNVMMSKTRSVCWIIISWLAAICFFMPPMLSFKSSFFNRSVFLCQADTHDQLAYIVTSVTLVSMPVLLALLITNAYLFTRGYKKRIRFYEKVFVELSTRPWNYHITFVMCAVMVVLWTPFCLLRFFVAVADIGVSHQDDFYLCWLGFCCSFSNFLVLFSMCTAFRKAVYEMYGVYDWCPSWCCCCCCRRVQQSQHRYSSNVNVITLTRKR